MLPTVHLMLVSIFSVTIGQLVCPYTQNTEANKNTCKTMCIVYPIVCTLFYIVKKLLQTYKACVCHPEMLLTCVHTSQATLMKILLVML